METLGTSCVDKAVSRIKGLNYEVVALARIAGIEPAKLAKSLTDATTNADYTAKLTAEMIAVEVAESKKQAESKK